MSFTLFDLDPSELFEVVPELAMQAAWIGDADRVDCWEVLNGESRDIEEIVTNPALLAGTAFWLRDPLHALVLRNAARHQGRAAEAIWDLNLEKYIVLVAG